MNERKLFFLLAFLALGMIGALSVIFSIGRFNTLFPIAIAGFFGVLFFNLWRTYNRKIERKT